jgi:hypothetical protein
MAARTKRTAKVAAAAHKALRHPYSKYRTIPPTAAGKAINRTTPAFPDE